MISLLVKISHHSKIEFLVCSYFKFLMDMVGIRMPVKTSIFTKCPNLSNTVLYLDYLCLLNSKSILYPSSFSDDCYKLSEYFVVNMNTSLYLNMQSMSIIFFLLLLVSHLRLSQRMDETNEGWL